MNKEFQRALLQSLTQDPSLLPLLPQIQSKVFDLVEDQVYLELLNEYVKKFRTLPSKAEMGEYLDQNLVNKGVPSDVVKLIVSSLHNAFMPIQGEMDFVKGYLYGEIMGKKSTTLLKDFMARMKEAPITEMPSLIDWVVGEFGDIRRFGGGVNGKDAGVRSAGYIDQAYIRPVLEGNPTCIQGMNDLTAAKGFHTPQINIILSAPKAFKTGFMLTLAIGFMRNGLKVYWADTENGPDTIRNRVEQHLLRCNMEQLKDPSIYSQLDEVIKWNTKLKGTILIDGYIPYQSCVGDMLSRLDQLKKDDEFIPDVIFIDSIDHLIPTPPENRRKDERFQIRCVYFEVIAMNMKLGCFTFAPSQVNRAALDRKVFSPKDIGEDFSKIANCHSCWALCRTEEEVEANLCRLVIVVQRQGKKYRPDNVVVLNMEEEFGIVEEISYEEAANRIGNE